MKSKRQGEKEIPKRFSSAAYFFQVLSILSILSIIVGVILIAADSKSIGFGDIPYLNKIKWSWLICGVLGFFIIWFIIFVFKNSKKQKASKESLKIKTYTSSFKFGNFWVNLLIVGILLGITAFIFGILHHAFWEKQSVITVTDTPITNASIPPKYDNFTAGPFCFKKNKVYTYDRGTFIGLELTPVTRNDCSTLVYLERIGYPAIYTTIGFDSVGHVVVLASNDDMVPGVKWCLTVSKNATLKVGP